MFLVFYRRASLNIMIQFSMWAVQSCKRPNNFSAVCFRNSQCWRLFLDNWWQGLKVGVFFWKPSRFCLRDALVTLSVFSAILGAVYGFSELFMVCSKSNRQFVCRLNWKSWIAFSVEKLLLSISPSSGCPWIWCKPIKRKLIADGLGLTSHQLG